MKAVHRGKNGFRRRGSVAFPRVAVLGLGLMGGSLGLALRRGRPASFVTGYARRPAVRRYALRHGVVDAVFADPAECVRDADLVVLCVPVRTIPGLAAACAPGLKPGCVVTDVGSTKAAVVTELRRRLAHCAVHVVGSHPIAGSDQAGIEASMPDLYEGATVVVTRDRSTHPGALARVVGFWKQLGGRPSVMRPDEHDRALAATSHLPHLAAVALVNAVLSGRHRMTRFCGSGFRDATRIAAGSEAVWQDIVETNRATIARELDRFVRELTRLRAAVRRADSRGLATLLTRARRLRLSFTCTATGSTPGPG
jgi:cyclohexadieny/prephenate dehydrogenase